MGRQERLNPNHLIQTAPPRVRDAVGRVLEVGDEVVMIVPKVSMRVAQITPLLDQPGMPPGLMKVVLVTRAAIPVPRDTGIEDLYFTRHQAEIGDGAIDLGTATQETNDGRDQADPPRD